MTTRRIRVAYACVLALTFHATTARADEATARYCQPTQPCWPSDAEWRALAQRVHGRLVRPALPFDACIADARSAACAAAVNDLRNPYWIEDQPGGTESLGWLDAWMATPSTWAVAVESAADVAAAIDFAHRHRLRVVVKGTGHDYLGRSTAEGGSLLIWTHKLRQIQTHEAFTPLGCGGAGVPAVSVGAGTRWLEAYRAVAVEHGRYVQGGGCLSVGAAGGFLQGGGFGSWSKRYGIAAASLLEAEVVTADGRVHVVNPCREPDLFWALRGGGGGTFGVVTRATLRTHPMPATFGFVEGSIKADSDAAFLAAIEQFARLYQRSLANEHWGEQVRIRPDNTIAIFLSFIDLTREDVAKTFAPLREFVARAGSHLTMTVDIHELPARSFWDPAFLHEHAPAVIVDDARRSGDLYWWRANQSEVATYWYAYQSRWLPDALFADARVPELARTLFAASRHWPLELHFNKGQAGAAEDARRRDRETAMNPTVLDAAALVIVAANGGGHPSVRGREPDVAAGRRERAAVAAAMKVLRDATPEAGSYVNETDYFAVDWKRDFWGIHYPQLLAIKHKYDPDGVFFCHHCVGSDELPASR